MWKTRTVFVKLVKIINYKNFQFCMDIFKTKILLNEKTFEINFLKFSIQSNNFLFSTDMRTPIQTLIVL